MVDITTFFSYINYTMNDKFSDDIDDFEENFDKYFYDSLGNSYNIFLGIKTYVEIIAEQNEPYFFFFDPTEVPSKEDILDLIHMYEDYEDYEKCGELLNLMKYTD